MVFTAIGKSGLALAFIGSMDKPNHLCIGSGSGAVSVSRTNLIAQVGSSIFSSVDASTVNEVSFQADFGASSMSGINLREFGVKAGSGTLFNIEGFDAVNFNGTQELQIQVTFQIF